MTSPEEQNIDSQLDPYLGSPKTFHLEMPLYHIFDLSIGMMAEKIYKFLTFSGTIDAYCIWCDKESVFDALLALWEKEKAVLERVEDGFC